jgi:hypothetical protein
MEEKRQKILAAFDALAVVATHFHELEPDEDDADDYLETMMVTESLIECGGFNHRDIVARFRKGRRTEMVAKETAEVVEGRIGTKARFPNKVLWTGNRDPKHTQMGKLRASKDPFYLAEDGITDGAAMRMLGVALYFPSFEEMVYAANAVARITHAHIEARLAAVLVALRCRQYFTGDSVSYERLLKLFDRAICLLNLRNDDESITRQTFRVCDKFKELPFDDKSRMSLIAREIGFRHIAFSAPVAAVATSLSSVYPSLPKQPRTIGLEGMFSQYDAHSIKWYEESSSVGPFPSYAFRGPDADTYYSILYPMLALAGYKVSEGLPNRIFERYRDIADALASRWT